MAFGRLQGLPVPSSPVRSVASRRALVCLVALVAILALCAGWLAMSSRHGLQPLPVLTAQPHDPRIVYLPGRYPVLTLPDGERRVVRSLLAIERPLHFGDYVWDDAGVPPGSVWVRIDLSLQTLSVFRAGHEIGSTLILYGADGKPTPAGVYPILERAERHRSTLYDAEMPFMLRLTPDGVAIHASTVRAAAATHGCIGVPLQFARLLFAQAQRGDQVAILSSR